MTERKDALDKKLFNEEFLKSEKHYMILFEEYKLYVDIMDKTSSRRDSSNNFYLTLNSAIVTLSTLLYGLSSCPAYLADIWLIIVGVIGIIVCRSWLQTINSYKKLNEGRFEVISRIEEKLPAQIFNAEWLFLKHGNEEPKSEYKELTKTEIQVPWIFKVVYAAIILIGLILFFNLNITNVL